MASCVIGKGRLGHFVMGGLALEPRTLFSRYAPLRVRAQPVDFMYQLGGGAPVSKRSPLERICRNTHVATQHMMIGPGPLELTGRFPLGPDTYTLLL